MEALLLRYGYALLFLGVAVEGEAFLVGALWAIPTAVLAFYAGGAIESLLVELRGYEVLIAAAVVLVPAAYLGARRLGRLVRRQDLRFGDVHALLPFAVGLMGLLNLLSAIVPRPPETVAILQRWLPLEVTQRSRPLMLFAG